MAVLRKKFGLFYIVAIDCVSVSLQTMHQN